MMIKELHVRNFRSLYDVCISFDNLTALLGSNGAGKSSLLKSLELFFASNAKYEKEDFYNEEISSPIVISVVFNKLSDEALDEFKPYIHNSELCIIKEMHYPCDKSHQRYYGQKLSNPDFSSLRTPLRAADMRSKYNELKKNFSDLPEAKTKEEISNALEEWERNNTGKCDLIKDEHQFFGYKEVGGGKIDKYVKFLPIPAVREASLDATESRGSVLSELMDLTVRKILTEKEELRQLNSDTRDKYKKILSGGEINALETELSQMLSMYAPGVGVKIRWITDELDILSYIKANAFLVEDGYEAPVALSGNGSQRAFIMTLLQYLAARPQNTNVGVDDSTKSVPSLILAIEEPELFQHPNRQRNLLKVIHELACNGIQNVISDIQVIYTTHSPLLFHIDQFDLARRFHKTQSNGTKKKQTKITWGKLDELAKKLDEVNDKPKGTYSESTLKPRLRAIMTPWMNEGFFADTVVLVEGEEDRGAILGEAELLNYNFDALGISVIPCSGKPNIDRPFVIFNSLEIPVYVVWDNDKKSKNPNVEINHRLLKLLGGKVEDFPSIVDENFSCFENNIGEILKKEIEEEYFDNLLKDYQKEFEICRKEQAAKNPLIITKILHKSKEEGHTSQTLELIVKKIVGLRNNHT